MWTKDGIRLNMVAPAFVETQIIEWARRDENMHKAFLKSPPFRPSRRSRQSRVVAVHRISGEIVQMHGGIGMTADRVAGRYLKWARVSEKLYCDSQFLADCYATATGF